VGDVHLFDDKEWPFIAARRLTLTRRVRCRITDEPGLSLIARFIKEGDLVQIEKEEVDPREMFLCQVLGISQRGLRVSSYDRSLRSAERVTMQLKDCTKITFADRYSNAALIALRAVSRKVESKT
jgi:hypothetical protein